MDITTSEAGKYCSVPSTARRNRLAKTTDTYPGRTSTFLPREGLPDHVQPGSVHFAVAASSYKRGV